MSDGAVTLPLWLTEKEAALLLELCATTDLTAVDGSLLLKAGELVRAFYRAAPGEVGGH